MGKENYHVTDEAFALFAEKYPNVRRSDVEALLTQEMLVGLARRAQQSEVEALKNQALNTMGTGQEMAFADLESRMLKASLSDGRHALKEIMEKTPTVAPLCSDGTKMKDQGRKKKHHDNTGAR